MEEESFEPVVRRTRSAGDRVVDLFAVVEKEKVSKE